MSIRVKGHHSKQSVVVWIDTCKQLLGKLTSNRLLTVICAFQTADTLSTSQPVGAFNAGLELGGK